MVEEVVALLLVGGHDALEPDEEGVDALDLDVAQATQTLHGVHQVGDAVQTAAEGVEFAEDVVLTVWRKEM